MLITKIALFKGRKIRKILCENEWWFSVIDVVAALTDSVQPSKYWTAMKARVQNESEFQLSTICRQLKSDASRGGKIAGVARIELEKEINRPVVSAKNYLQKKEKGALGS